jgi:DNA-binding beta-propeller fold protein YncE
MKRLPLSFILVLLTALTAFSQNYKIVHKFPVPGEGGWDYVTSDPETGRLFVSHGNVVNVINEKDGKLLGTIPDTKGVHGIALAPDLNKGFISDGRDSSVTVFDLKTLDTLGKLPVTGINPDCIIYDQYTHRIFTFNGRSHNSTVFDAKTNKVVATIPLAGKPEYAVSNERGKVYVNIEDKKEIGVINTRALAVELYRSIAPGESASGLAIDLKNYLLFAVCDNKMMVVMNAENGHIITTVPIGEGPDACAFDPDLNRIYSSNGDGTITVVQEVSASEFKVIETIPTQKGARTMAVDTKTHHLYLPAAEYGEKPEATSDNPHPRPKIKSGSFVILDVAGK